MHLIIIDTSCRLSGHKYINRRFDTLLYSFSALSPALNKQSSEFGNHIEYSLSRRSCMRLYYSKRQNCR